MAAQITFLHFPVILVPFFLLALIYFFVFPNDLRLQSAFVPCTCTPTTTSSSMAARSYKVVEEPVDLRVLLGVLTRPDFYERRALLRLAYRLQPRPVRAVVDVRFVFCRVDREEDAALVALEVIAHGDIVVLGNCTENMNDGKTYEFFSSVPRLFAGDGEEPYDYVGKADDDTYYRLGALADSLRTKARRDMHHGFLYPCHTDPERQFMVGWGYVVSWDVAVWISETTELRNDTRGAEDMTFRRWLRWGGKGKNVYGEEPRMYDYLDREKPDKEKNCFRHELMADTVAVHRLKDRLRWARTLSFFNATRGLRPSKLYHLDLRAIL